MYGNVLVDCSNCRTPLQLPPGAQSLRCAICQAITHVAAPVDHYGVRGYQYPQPLPQYGHSQAAPSPYNHAPPGPPPNMHGRKKAVIIGISYKNTRHELDGCLNDAKCMRHLLIHRFHFPEASILMLTEEEKDPKRIPTKRNIQLAFKWLVQGCQPGDSLVLHFSGHGSQQRDRNGDEADGYDETLVPLDFKKQGMIVDDEINATVVRPIPPGVRLHAIIDACHSGTMLDLPFLCRMNRNGKFVWEDHRPRKGYKGSGGGEVISFSGCDDSQTSEDTTELSKVTSTGAMTFCFIQAIERGYGTTYGSILTAMRAALKNGGKLKGNNGAGGVTSLINMLVSGGSGRGRFKQEPQLTAWETFDVHSKPFFL